MDERKQIKIIYLFPNGNTAVFDCDGEQIPELQNNAITALADTAQSKGWTVEQIEGAEVKGKGTLKHYTDPDTGNEWWNF